MLKEEKRAMRQAAIARRDAIPPEKRAEAARAIAERVTKLAAWPRARTVAAYVPIGSEVDARALIESALAEGKRVAVPRTDRIANEIVMHEITSLAELRPGAFRIPEPDPAVHRDLAPQEIDLVLVPGVAFDRGGHRLGYGRGFFDRWLARFRGAKVGLAYEAIVGDRLPSEPHDVRVDFVVTEEREFTTANYQ